MTTTTPVLQVKLLHPQAELPFRATEESIGVDLRAYLISETGREISALVAPNRTVKIRTGIAVRPQKGFAVLICSRSGLAQDSIFVANAPGVVDPDYTGEIQVLLFNGGYTPYYVQHRMRIAQAILVPAYVPRLLLTDELPQTKRGDKGFGSTGEM